MKIPPDMVQGTIHKTNNCGNLKVLLYRSEKNVEVVFLETNGKRTASSGDIRSGSVKDYYKRTVHGVGYVGNGRFKPTINGKISKCYIKWSSMIARCYDEKTQEKRPTYKGCIVVDEWHNFQNFAEWYYSNKPEDSDDIHLDKDIKIEGNKTYGPEFCLLVTAQENIEKAKAISITLVSPDGVTFDVYNVNKFAKENGLTQSALVALGKGRYKTHKGWKLGG